MDNWTKVEDLFHAALAEPPDSRSEFLHQACEGDPRLRGEVQALLDRAQSDGFLEGSPLSSVVLPPLSPGQKVGVFEIVELIGRGGMGEVYKARDTRLGRLVALKRSRDRFSARFEREARAIAALNHPNICTLYDVGPDYLVIEFIEGETLGRRIGGKPLAVGQTIDIAMEIAEALAVAHAKGIIHRDIKPGNIFITESQTGGHMHVKVLDFGLAKLAGQASAEVAESLTCPGSALGTIGYMSPEQARGENLDARTDLFSFGVVLYEMATGKLPFQGATNALVFEAILHREPEPPARLNPEISIELERIILKLLEKDRNPRYQSASDVLVDLRRLRRGSDPGGNTFPAPVWVTSAEHPIPKPFWQRIPGPLAIAALLLMGVAAWLWFRTNRILPVQAVPVVAEPGEAGSATFSPDGGQIAFSWRREGDRDSHIYVKSIGSESTRQLSSGPYNDTSPVWSPDGRLIAFLRESESRSELSRGVIPAPGGEPRILFTRQRQLVGNRDAWTSDGKRLIFTDRGSENAQSLLYSFALETGQLRPLTSGAGWSVDVFPTISPNGKLVAFVRGLGRRWVIAIMSVDGGDATVIPGTRNDIARAALAWEPDGRHLIYRSHQGGLWEVALSGSRPRRLPVGGDSADFPSVSARGDLAFTESFRQVALKQFVWPGGPAPASEKVVFESTRSVFDPRWSPDGKQIAFVSNRSGATEVWRCNADGTNLTQVTSLRGPLTRNPRWSPDGQNIAFDSVSGGHDRLHVTALRGGADRVLTSGDSTDFIPAWSPDGKKLYFNSLRTGTWQIWSIPALGGAATQVTFLGGFFPAVSPDNYLYYVRATGGTTLLRMPAGGGAEEVVLDSELAFHGLWSLTSKGVFFIDGKDALRYFDLASRRSSQVLAQFRREELLYPVTSTTIGASPDGHSVLIPIVTRTMSDIMLVQRFWQR